MLHYISDRISIKGDTRINLKGDRCYPYISSSSSLAFITNATIPIPATTEYITNDPNCATRLYEHVTKNPAKIGPPPRLKLAPSAAKAFNFALCAGSTALFCVIVKAAFQLLNEMSIIPLIIDR